MNIQVLNTLKRLNLVAYQMAGPGWNVVAEKQKSCLVHDFILYYWNQRVIQLDRFRGVAETRIKEFLGERSRTRYVPR
jgi:hypothetical protein